MAEVLKYQGVTINIAGKEYTMPALSPYSYAKGKASEKLARIDKELKSGGLIGLSEESIMNIVELTTLALKRNYPDITEDEVGEGLPDAVALMELVQYLVSQDKKVQEEMEKARKNALEKLMKKAEK